MDIYQSKFIQGFRDIGNFFRFRRQMRRERKNPESEFNRLGLRLNRIGNIVYIQLNFSDSDFMNFGYNEERMLESKLRPIVRYLSSELDWGDYLKMQVENFVDGETMQESLSYGVMFLYSGYSLTITKFTVFALSGLAVLAALWVFFL